jgi:hypothetical protein
MEKHHRPRLLTKKELAEIAAVGGEGVAGRGQLQGELHVAGHTVELITAGRGTRSEVSFTLDVSDRKASHLEGWEVTVFGLIHKVSAYRGTITHATVIARPAAHHVPGEHLSVSGKIDNRTLAGPGGEAPPSGSYLLLAHALTVGASRVSEIFLEGREFDQGKSVKLYGRLEARSYGGVETGSHPYIALSGISDLGSGEPAFDGVQFHSAANHAQLMVLIVRRRDLFDAPNEIVVLDPALARAFLGSFGGHILPEANPFHGFSAATDIAKPTEADRAEVVFNKDGNAIDAATGAELLKVGDEPAPPGADRFSHTFYFNAATETVYAFVSGGIAGFVNRMESVIRFPVP